MNRVTITIDLPDGVTPDVQYGSPVRELRPGDISYGSPTTPQAPAAPPAAGAWVCPEHGSRKVVPAGVSKRTGKAYNAFVVCAEQGCDQNPPRGPGPGEAPTQFDDLPF